MNPLSLPVGIATRVLGDLAALAAAARATIPVAEALSEVDMRQIQDDLHTLARVAEDLPRVEGELTRRMDEVEDTAEAGVKQLERATAAAEAIVASLPVIEGGIAELKRATKAAEALAEAAPEIQAGVPELAKARAAAEKLTDSIPLLERMTEAGDKIAGEGLDEVREARASLLEARGQAEQLIAAAERAQGSLDRASENVEVALARAEPLQGLTERIARLNERLPGGGRSGGQP
jgi:methyl-accepting chemotaxis protein